MPSVKNPQKGVILLIVLATVLVVIILSGVVLSIITNQGSLTRHKISRTKAYYAARGIMNYTLDMLRSGTWAASSTSNRYACLGNCSGLGVTSPTYTIPVDSDIPYNILVTIYPLNRADNAILNGKVTQLNIKTDYTYIP
ncbi:MAG: hypothetical protein V1869_00730 [Candidatus Omnitrophota bacterium]